MWVGRSTLVCGTRQRRPSNVNDEGGVGEDGSSNIE